MPTATLRYYEQAKLIPEIRKTDSGHRVYTDADLEWIRVILCLRQTGMGIKDIQDFAALTFQGKETLPERLKLFLAHRQLVEEKIQSLNKDLLLIDYKIERYKKKIKEHHISME